MILSDRETRAARARGAIRITPEPAPAAWSSTAVDLTLDGPLSCWEAPKDQRAPLICPHAADFDFAVLSRQLGREVPLGKQGHVVEPLSFLLGWTVERIQLPHTARLAARVEGKSSLARLGLADAEREHILGVLRDTAVVVGGPKGAASRLGMKRSTLQKKMKKLGISWPE